MATQQAVTRETVRKKFAELLTAALTGAGKPVQQVFDHLPADFEQSPAVMVASGPNERSQGGFGPCWLKSIQLFVHVFVDYNDAVAGWTEADAETTLDVVEDLIAGVVMDNKALTDFWNNITYPFPTEPSTANVGGEKGIGGREYRHELIVLQFGVH